MKSGQHSTPLSPVNAAIATNLLSTTIVLLMRWPPGLALLLVGAYGGAYCWRASRASPQQPSHISVVTEAAILQPGEAAWVTLDDVVWDCSYLRYGEPGDIYIQSDLGFTDNTRSVWGIASFHRPAKITCSDTSALQATGVLALVRSPAGDFSLRLCTWCGRDNTR